MNRISLSTVPAAPGARIRNGQPCTPLLTRDKAMTFAHAVLSSDSLRDAVATIRKLARRLPARSHWRKEMLRLAKCLRVVKPRYQVFMLRGNVKLPFVSFSTLPIFTCPGYGACGKFCYSFRAWRRPEAYLRQLQNTLLLRFAPEVIAAAFAKIPENVDLRLYVDGDFDSLQTIGFWMGLLAERPDVRAYGYSKSWDLLMDYNRTVGAWPINYVLNLSSGGRAQTATAEDMERLPITRGHFVSVPIHYRPAGVKGNIGFKRYADPNYHNAVRAAAEAQGLGKVFSCPGKCGECTARGHLCGSMRAHGVTIAIGVH